MAAIERELAGAGYGSVALLPLLFGQDGVDHSVGRAGRTVPPGQEPTACTPARQGGYRTALPTVARGTATLRI